MVVDGNEGMIKLLLVDDQPVFRQGLAVLLREYSSEFEVVGEAANTDEAIAKVEQLNPDVVVADIGMKNGHGNDFIRYVHDRFPNVKILVLSVSERQEDSFWAIRAGASASLLKTTDLKELAESIRIVATGGFALSPFMIGKLVEELRNISGEKAKYLHMLTRREIEMLQYAAHGCSNKEIADLCFISSTTVKAHFRNIMRKLEVKNRTKAVALANSYGLLERD